MRWLLLVILLVGCEVPNNKLHRTPKEWPTVNLPLSLRQRNWIGNQREGSCTYASMISLLRWQGQYRLADWVKKNCGNGADPNDMAAKLNQAGIRYAYTTEGDVAFLEWACNTRRGCAITVLGGKHMVVLVHLDSNWAGLLDNNHVENIIWVPRATLIAEWRASHGWSVTPVGSPYPPMP